MIKFDAISFAILFLKRMSLDVSGLDSPQLSLSSPSLESAPVSGWRKMSVDVFVLIQFDVFRRESEGRLREAPLLLKAKMCSLFLSLTHTYMNTFIHTHTHVHAYSFSHSVSQHTSQGERERERESGQKSFLSQIPKTRYSDLGGIDSVLQVSLSLSLSPGWGL